MSSSLLALVLLNKPVTPDMSAVAKALRARHPELATETADNEEAQPVQANSPLIRCGDQLVAVMSMPAPIPQDRGCGNALREPGRKERLWRRGIEVT
ncbi:MULTISPECIES: hypothetical protein [Bradyrhizobium]|uniref:hypothetical protein n=1 Tax=Bradyrhizobium TaxID=374 RepID=UPI001FD7CA2D|nr:hypothetical protein [Bradyrhizobium vignae]